MFAYTCACNKYVCECTCVFHDHVCVCVPWPCACVCSMSMCVCVPWVCACVCYTSMCVCVCAHIGLCLYVCLHEHMCVCVYTKMCAEFTWTCARVRAYTTCAYLRRQGARERLYVFTSHVQSSAKNNQPPQFRVGVCTRLLYSTGIFTSARIHWQPLKIH